MSSATRDEAGSPPGAGLRRPSAGLAAPVHRLFEAQARRRPEAVALAVGGDVLTYGQLDARANRLASFLRAQGVLPESVVGLALDRDAEMVVALLAVLKAGGAYLPLDLAFPRDRLDWMLRDSGAPIVLTRSDLAGHLPDNDARPIFLVDVADEVARRHAERPSDPSRRDGLAYVLYTSGSTGRPKGVQVGHAALTNFLVGTASRLGFGRDDAILAVTTLSFDIAALEIFLPLVAGGRVELASRDEAVDGALLARRLADPSISFLQATPATWRMLIDAGWAGSPGLTMLCGGEALPRDLADRLLPRGRRLWNLYGPTEATVWCAAEGVEPGAGPVPIGRPLPNQAMYVLDGRLQLVPPGVVGELYVGGAGLARGYLGRPSLTAERFLPNPYGPAAGGRIYRTGDLARRRPDGSFEWVGRVDQQVKVRGFRVELGEVEAALGAIPGVRQAVAAARVDATGEQRLVGYLVAGADAASDPAGLRKFLESRLPEYMVPSAFVTLDALPLTPNGKVDRKALPEPEARAADAAPEFVPPMGPVEEAIASAWSDVLGVGRVGPDDHFFALGGHSLLATRVVSRLRDALGLEVPVRLLFEAPTVAGLAGRIEGLRLEARRRTLPPIRPVPRDGSRPLPLSFSQQALWYLEQVAPGEPTFHVTAAARVLGPLDLDALRRAFNEIVRRHEALRTSFPTLEGRPSMAIAPIPELDVPLDDLSGRPAPARAEECERLAGIEARSPFDLARGPLIRARVIRLGALEHAVLLTIHHIVTDGWSIGVAAAELSAIYDAFRRGRPSPLPELAIQYADYAAWQREVIRGAYLDELLAYWTVRLDGVPMLELPVDRPRPAVRTTRGAVAGFDLSPEASATLHSLCRREGVTPFMALLAAFQVLLHRLSGLADFAVGSPIANRSRGETEGLIGYFVNMLPLRADLSGAPSFRTLLGRVRESCLSAYEHQDLPLELLVERLQPRRDPGRTPLFQAMFVLQNNAMPDADREELELDLLDGGGRIDSAKFELSLILHDDGDRFSGGFEYNTDLFDRATAERLCDQFRRLVDGLLADPGRRVLDAPILSDVDRATLVGRWGRGEVGRGAAGDGLVPDLFEAQARLTPGATAVSSGPETLTYRELSGRVDRLARRLRRLGVGPESRVGLAVERSNDLAVGLLGILRAGGAFVPLDPAYPPERLALMAADANTRVVVTQRRLAGKLAHLGETLVCVDDPEGGRDAGPDAAGVSGIRPDHAAYVLYTSGTTGTPRGVVVSHRSLANHNVAAADLFGLAPGDRVLQFASPSFDLAIEEIFPALIRGAAVVFRDDEALDPGTFHDWLARHRITVADLPTAFWHAWAGALPPRAVPACLRLVVVGGEAARPAALRRWREVAGDRVRWLNTYGPTEATVIATSYEAAPGDLAPGASESVPIGGPIANALAYVLDARLAPAPIGVPGELYLGGAGVARGYLHRPAATAERFLPDPFAGQLGARMYRTGDRARWRADGRLEFLGRLDDQVKVRGFRVEPGEVESILVGLPGLRAAAVTVSPTEPDRLVAYLVPEPETEIDPERILDVLRKRLPRHLVPSDIVRLDSLPMTPSGKLDRKALQAPGPSVREAGPGLIAPRDDLEAQLVAIWEEVLGRRGVGVTDDFFDLGGHSLLAVQLASRIESRLGRTLPLSTFLLGATIEGIARVFRTLPAADRPGPALRVLADPGRGTPIFCVHPVGGGVACYRSLAELLGESRPVYGVEAAGFEGAEPPGTRLEGMAARYVDAIAARHPGGPYHLAGWSMGGAIAYEMARQLAASGAEVGEVALLDSRVPTPGSFPDDEDALLAAFAADLARGAGVDLPRPPRRLRGLGPGAWLDWASRELDGTSRVLDSVGADRLARLFDVFRSHARALAAYEPGPYPGRLIVFQAAEGRGAGADPSLGWARLAASVEALDVPGGHHDIVRGEAVELVARRLRGRAD